MSDLFDFTPKPKQFAVFGNPIEHSKSPQIHHAFAQQTGIHLEYHATLVEQGGFIQAVEHFRASNGKGLNITVPFKQDAYKLADHLSERAQQAEAINTLWFDDQGGIHGDNTDGVGLVTDLQNNIGFSLQGQRVLIAGAGGAVRGVLGPLLSAGVKEIVIANRTVSKARDLANAFGDSIKASSYRDLDKAEPFDLVINGTAASLSGDLPPLANGLFKPTGIAYDMMYGQQPTVFMSWALNQGAASAHDGLGMLIEQAAAAFAIWNGPHPDTAPVIEQLRKL